jgi:hypothetical protein
VKKRTLALLATLVMTATVCLTLAGVALAATNVPAWWIDRGEMRLHSVGQAAGAAPASVLVPPPSPVEYFTVMLAASDPNSGLAPPGIEFRLPTWLPPQYAVWQPYADFNEGHGFELFVERASHTTDGIFPLDYRARDQAGNTMSATVSVKIDTRPPVTAGASGWVNGLEPYALTAIDQAPGSGVAATVYRVDQSTPWQVNVAANVAPTLTTEVAVTPPGSAPVQGSIHTVDFGSVDAALPFDYDPHTWTGPSYRWGNLEGTSWVWAGTKDQAYIQVFTGYQTRTVQLDVTAPLVTAMDPKNGAWQQGPAVVNFSGTDVGSGYAYTEWSTDGVNWATGEVAAIGGDGETTVSYRGVDKVGLKSATQTIVVRVATTPPTVTAEDVSVKRGQRATFAFNVTAVTPTAQVIIQLRSKEGRTLSTHRFAGVPTNADTSRSFRVHLAKGTYDIRVGAVDEAGNVQTQRGAGTLTVR